MPKTKTAKAEPALVRAVSLARDGRRRLEAGEATSNGELARRLGLCRHHAGRIAPLGYLAPDLVAMILEGRQPPALNLQSLTKATLPLAWTDQRRLVRSFT
jgi:site-specific DNA recombinase